MTDTQYASIRNPNGFPGGVWSDSLSQARVYLKADHDQGRKTSLYQREVQCINASGADIQYRATAPGNVGAWTSQAVDVRRAYERLLRNGHEDARIETRVLVYGPITPVPE